MPRPSPRHDRDAGGAPEVLAAKAKAADEAQAKADAAQAAAEVAAAEKQAFAEVYSAAK